MQTKAVRDIIRIDEEKCDGCGACVLSCAEGALAVIDGKARLVSDVYCDGLGACLGECPQGALTIERRESDAFDEGAVERRLEAMQNRQATTACAATTQQHFAPEAAPRDKAEDRLSCGCPGSMAQEFSKAAVTSVRDEQPSMLAHWPVQLALVSPNAPFLRGANLLLAAHCGPFAYGGFHSDFIKEHAVVCACPKLDNAQAHLEKLTDILRGADVRSLTVVRMEVPCCGGLVHMAREAIAASGKDIPLREVVIGTRGNVVVS